MIWILALRNIRRNLRRTVLTVGMMVFGFILFSFFVAINVGSYGTIINQFIREKTGHFQVHAPGYLDQPRFQNTLQKYEEPLRRLRKKPGVQGAAARIVSGALAFHQNQSMGVSVIGVEPAAEARTTTLKKRVRDGNYFDPEDSASAIVGQTVAEVLKLEVGSEVALISQGADGSIANDLFRVKGVIRNPSKTVDDFRVYLPLNAAQRFFVLPGRVHEVAVTLESEDPNVDEWVRMVGKAWSEAGLSAEVSPWREVEKDFYQAMQADQVGDRIGKGILAIMLAIGVLNTVLMSMLERMREFGVLRALGTSPLRIFSMICAETVLLGLIATVLGSVLSVGVNTYFVHQGIRFDEPFEYGGMVFDRLYAVIVFRDFYEPFLIIMGTALAVSLYPAYRAAKVSPVEALRSL